MTPLTRISLGTQTWRVRSPSESPGTRGSLQALSLLVRGRSRRSSQRCVSIWNAMSKKLPPVPRRLGSVKQDRTDQVLLGRVLRATISSRLRFRWCRRADRDILRLASHCVETGRGARLDNSRLIVLKHGFVMTKVSTNRPSRPGLTGRYCKISWMTEGFHTIPKSDSLLIRPE